MSKTIRKLSTGAGPYGPDTEFNGALVEGPCALDYVTVTTFTGSGLGTSFMRINLYDDVNSSNQSPFIDLSIPQGDDSETFSVFRNITTALHGVFTGSGSVTATYR